MSSVPPNLNPGILLVGHGTRDELGTREFFQLSDLLQQRCQPVAVEPSLLEFQSPTIPEAWQKLTDQGVTHVHVAPLLLFAAGHAKQDIPEMVLQCIQADPRNQADRRNQADSLTMDQSRPLSRHPSILKLTTQRIDEALRDSDADPNRTAVVMVGRGSYDPCASADMRVLTEIIRHRMKLPNVVTAFYAMAEPRLPAVLRDVANTGNFDRVLVYSHLLFHGRLYQAIVKQTNEAAAEFPKIDFRCTDYLGANASVAEAIADRVLRPETGCQPE